MNKLALLFCIILIPLLYSCSGTVLNDAASIKTIKDTQDRTANTTWTVSFDCQNGTNKDSQFTRKVTGPETTLNTLPSDPVKQGYSFAGWWTQPNGGGSPFDADTPVTANISIYAKWSTIPVYLVCFDSQNGTRINNRKVTEKDTLMPPETPKKTGFVFGGWYLEKTCDTPWNFDTNVVTENETLYAKWNSYTWTVTFITGENKSGSTANDTSDPVIFSVISPKTITETLPENPTKSGVSFAGWWSNSDGTGTQFTSSTPVTANTTVYAKWSTSPVYTVSFDSTGGSYVGAQTVEENKTATRPNDPEKTGYIFSGWYTQADGKGAAFSNLVKINSNSVFYAFWKNYTYTVTFIYDTNGRTDTHIVLTVQTPATTLTKLPDFKPKKSGYLFAGWFTDQNGNGLEFTQNTPVTANTTVYAAWDSYDYTITFLKNDGTLEPEPTTLTISSPNTTIEGLPTDPIRTGYIFTGWNSSADGTGTVFLPSTNVSADTTVYAKWTKAFTVYFNPNGGSGTMKEQTITIGSNTPLNENQFTRDGFTFDGWAINSYGTCAYPDTSEYNPLKPGNTTLYATWTINTYTISFNPNGGKGKMSDISMEYNRTTSLNPNRFNRENYTFIGWSTAPDKAVAYLNLAIFRIKSENITLYAVWKNNLSSDVNLFTWKISKKQIQITGLSDEWSAGRDTELVLPDNINGMPVCSIMSHAFEKRTSLISVNIPASVEKIEDYAFAGCSNLGSFEIPASVTAIGTGVFNDCNNLEKLVVDPKNNSFIAVNGILFSADKTTLYRFPAGKPDDNYSIAKTITSVLASAFNGNRYLDRITIPASVMSIGDGAFSGCTGLDSITLLSTTPPSLGNAVFDKDAKLIINVPKKAITAYTNATNWAVWSKLLAGY